MSRVLLVVLASFLVCAGGSVRAMPLGRALKDVVKKATVVGEKIATQGEAARLRALRAAIDPRKQGKIVRRALADGHALPLGYDGLSIRLVDGEPVLHDGNNKRVTIEKAARESQSSAADLTNTLQDQAELINNQTDVIDKVGEILASPETVRAMRLHQITVPLVDGTSLAATGLVHDAPGSRRKPRGAAESIKYLRGLPAEKFDHLWPQGLEEAISRKLLDRLQDYAR